MKELCGISHHPRQTHDPEALTEIYQRYHPVIYRYIYQRVRDIELAEDIASEVFVRMLEGINRFEDRGWPISAWLYRIARDRSIDIIRRQSKRATMPLILAQSGRRPGGIRDPQNGTG